LKGPHPVRQKYQANAAGASNRGTAPSHQEEFTMKWSDTIRIGLLAVAAATLAGCGGGGDAPTPIAGFDSTEFQGIWKRNDGTATGNPANCFNFNEIGDYYGGRHRPGTLTATIMTAQAEVYSDTTCTTYLGLLERDYSVTWSAGTLPGKSNVARVAVTLTGFSIQRDGAAGFTMRGVPQIGVTVKGLLDVDGALMHIEDMTAPKDADGYPTALQATALYTR
jgi:hypothetical protein